MLTRTLVITVLLAVLLTVVVAPILVTAFRSKVTRSMNLAARAASHCPPAVDWYSPLVPGRGFGRLPRVAAGGAMRPSPREQALRTHTRRTLNRLAIAYGCGGAAQAAVLAFFVLLGLGSVSAGPLVWLSMWLVLALPVAPTIAYVLATRPLLRILWMAGALGVAVLVSGDARGLVWDAFLLYVLAPAVLLVLFSLRFWRATAPLVLVLALGGSLGWLGLVEVGKLVVGNDAALWVFRLLGLAAGALLALPVARGIGRFYQAKRTSEQMLFLDAWWALLTFTQTTVLVAVDGPGQLVTLSGFGAYLLVTRVLLGRTPRDRPPAARLLVLRVFGHDRRTERLLDELTLRWRPFGTVDLIAGRDLALRNIDPSELYTFLTGRLSREFVQGHADLDQRLVSRDDRPDPDGRYRINQFFCHVDTWQLVLDRLITRCDAVLMDLRGFDERRRGCQYEIGRLARYAGMRPIVLLADATTKLELVEPIFNAAAPSRSPAGRVFVLDTGRSGRGNADTATALLLGALPG